MPVTYDLSALNPFYQNIREKLPNALGQWTSSLYENPQNAIEDWQKLLPLMGVEETPQNALASGALGMGAMPLYTQKIKGIAKPVEGFIKKRPKPQLFEGEPNEFYKEMGDKIRLSVMRAGQESTHGHRGGTWFENIIYPDQHSQYQTGKFWSTPHGVGGKEVIKKDIEVKNPLWVEWPWNRNEAEIVLDLAKQIYPEKVSKKLSKGVTGLEAEKAFSNLESHLADALKQDGFDAVIFYQNLRNKKMPLYVPKQTFYLGD